MENCKNCKNCIFWEIAPHRAMYDRQGYLVLYGKCKANHIWDVDGEGLVKGDSEIELEKRITAFKKYKALAKHTKSTSPLFSERYGCIHFKIK